MNNKPKLTPDPMKTYSESQDIPTFDWRHALNNPQEFNSVILRLRACEWVTCACGNLCNVIARDFGGEPEDEELRELGINFSEAVRRNHFNLALVILDRIEARSAILIATPI